MIPCISCRNDSVYSPLKNHLLGASLMITALAIGIITLLALGGKINLSPAMTSLIGASSALLFAAGIIWLLKKRDPISSIPVPESQKKPDDPNRIVLNDALAKAQMQRKARIEQRKQFLINPPLVKKSIPLESPEENDGFLPNEILQTILFNFTAKEICDLCLVSKRWRNCIINHPVFALGKIYSHLSENELSISWVISQDRFLVQDIQEDTLAVYNLEKKEMSNKISLPSGAWATDILFSDQNKLIVVGLYEQNGRTIVTYDENFTQCVSIVKAVIGKVFLASDLKLGGIYALAAQDDNQFSIQNVSEEKIVQFSLAAQVTCFLSFDQQFYLATKEGAIFVFDQKGIEIEHFQALENPNDYVTTLWRDENVLLSISVQGIVKKWQIIGQKLFLFHHNQQEAGTVKIIGQNQGRLFGIISTQEGEELLKGWELYPN